MDTEGTGGGEDLRGIEGGKTIIRMCCMKKSFNCSLPSLLPPRARRRPLGFVLLCGRRRRRGPGAHLCLAGPRAPRCRAGAVGRSRAWLSPLVTAPLLPRCCALPPRPSPAGPAARLSAPAPQGASGCRRRPGGERRASWRGQRRQAGERGPGRRAPRTWPGRGGGAAALTCCPPGRGGPAAGGAGPGRAGVGAQAGCGAAAALCLHSGGAGQARDGCRSALGRAGCSRPVAHPRAVPRGDPGWRRGPRAAVGARAGEGRGPVSLAQDARVGTLCLWPLHKEALATASVKLGQKCIQLANLLPASW